MHHKFQCHYKLTINWEDDKGNPQQAIITDPITIDFNISKTTQSENYVTINIYNLDQGTREALYQDVILMDINPTVKMLTLEAGYQEQLALVSLGYIQECHSYKNGVDFVTTMTIIDPDILTEYCGVTFEAGTTFQEAYQYLCGRLNNLQVGETGLLEGIFEIPTVFNGNTFVCINKLTGGHTYIDNMNLVTLNDNECLSDYECYYIAGETGLLETPKRYDHLLEITMLFEPTIKVGQMVEIKSSTQGRFDGQYKVLGLNHNCTISGAESGTRITTLQLQFLPTLVSPNENLTQEPEGNPPSVVKDNKITPIKDKITSAVKDIYKHIMKNNGQVPNQKINNLITWKNMIYSGNNKPQDVKKHISESDLAHCETIATYLADFCNKYFPGKTIRITSGYRTPENNASIEGSSPNSNHTRGQAIDFNIPGVPLNTLKARFKQSWKYGLLTNYNWGIHVSTNPNERNRRG